MTELAVDEGLRLEDEVVSYAKELLDGKDEVVRIISPGISALTIRSKKGLENTTDWRANGRVARYISTESEIASEVSPEDLSDLLEVLKVSVKRDYHV